MHVSDGDADIMAVPQLADPRFVEILKPLEDDLRLQAVLHLVGIDGDGTLGVQPDHVPLNRPIDRTSSLFIRNLHSWNNGMSPAK